MDSQVVVTQTEWASTLMSPLIEHGTDIGTRLIGAVILYFVGRLLIGIVKRMIGSSMKRSAFDATLVRYVDSAASVLLNVLLILAILSLFGVETTTFAGLLAAAGVAIGMAWSGLLSNFAAGAFMIVLRPFKVGDFIEAGGITGTVDEVGLFATTLTTLDNVKTIVGNNTIFSGNIKNYSALPVRRVDLFAQLAHDADVPAAIAILEAELAKIQNVETTPAPDVQILEFNLAGPKLCVRPYTANKHYWQVYFDTNLAIRQSLGEAGFSVPEQHYRVEHNAMATAGSAPTS